MSKSNAARTPAKAAAKKADKSQMHVVKQKRKYVYKNRKNGKPQLIAPPVIQPPLATQMPIGFTRDQIIQMIKYWKQQAEEAQKMVDALHGYLPKS